MINPPELICRILQPEQPFTGELADIKLQTTLSPKCNSNIGNHRVPENRSSRLRFSLLRAGVRTPCRRLRRSGLLLALQVLAILSFGLSANLYGQEKGPANVLFTVYSRIHLETWSGTPLVAGDAQTGPAPTWGISWEHAPGGEVRQALNTGSAKDGHLSARLWVSLVQPDGRFVGWGGISTHCTVPAYVRGMPGTGFSIQRKQIISALAEANPISSGPITVSVARDQANAGRGTTQARIRVNEPATVEKGVSTSPILFLDPNHPTQQYSLAYQDEIGPSIFYLVDHWDYQGGLVEGTANLEYELIVNRDEPKLVVSPREIDFGILPVRRLKEGKFVVRNAGDQTLEYQIGPVTPPFTIENDSLPHSLAPGQSEEIVVHFAPTMADGGDSFAASAVIKSNDPNTPEVAIRLSGVAERPKPVNFRKTRATWDAFVEKTLPEWLGGVNERTIITKVRFESSTGNLQDLEGVKIYDILAYKGGIPFNRQPIRKALGCEEYESPLIELPLPWVPKVLNSEPLYATEFNKSYSLSGEMLVMDRHSFEDVMPPLVEGEWRTEQIYVWTMPWHKDDEKGCLIVEKALEDVITRKLSWVQGGSWLGNLVSQQAGSLAFQVESPSIGRTVHPDGFIPMRDLDELQLEWSVLGDKLLRAPTPNGPWVEVPNSDTVTKHKFKAGAESEFFKVVPLVPRSAGEGGRSAK